MITLSKSSSIRGSAVDTTVLFLNLLRVFITPGAHEPPKVVKERLTRFYENIQ